MDVYSMREDDFRDAGREHGEKVKGDVSAAFDMIASEVDMMAYFGCGITKRIAYIDGFKEGFGLD